LFDKTQQDSVILDWTTVYP